MANASTRSIARLAGLALGLGSSFAVAQTATWNNPAGGVWNDPLNWLPNTAFPDNGGVNNYLVTVNLTGPAYVVTLNQDITVTDFTLDTPDATFELQNFTFQVENDWVSRNGAVIDGLGSGASITVSGVTTFEDGAIRNTALFTALGPVIYSGPLAFDIDDTDIDHGNGSAAWAGPGTINLLNGSSITNGPSSTFTISGAAQMTGTAGTTFVNEGIIVRDTSPGTTDVLGVEFQNPGTLDVQAGTFRADTFVLGGGDTLTGGTYRVNGGSIDLDGLTIQTNQAAVEFVGAGTFAAFNSVTTNDTLGTIAVGGGVTFAPINSVQNNGLIDVAAASTFDASAGLSNLSGTTLDAGEFDLRGTLRLPAASSIVTVGSALTLDGPTSQIVDAGNADALAGFSVVDAGGELAVLGGRNLTTGGDVTLNGDGRLRVGVSSTVTVGGFVTNLASGTFTDGGLEVEGLLIFQDADIDTVDGDLSLNDVNARIEDQFGNDAFRNLDTVTTNGALGITNGRNLGVTGSLDTAGAVTIGSAANASALTVPGAYNMTAGTTTLSQGTINAEGGFNMTGGTLRGNGRINGDLVLNGSIMPGFSPGLLTLDGNAQIGLEAVIQFELGGLAPGSEGHDQIEVLSEALSFEGGRAGVMQIVLLPGFFPELGEIFRVVDAANAEILGQFDRYEGLDAGNGYQFAVQYFQPDPSGPVLAIDVMVTAIPSPGVAGVLALGMMASRRRVRGC